VRLLRVNLLVIILSSALFILGIEVFHRFKAPYRAFGGAYELTQVRHGARDGVSAFVVDPDLASDLCSAMALHALWHAREMAMLTPSPQA